MCSTPDDVGAIISAEPFPAPSAVHPPSESGFGVGSQRILKALDEVPVQTPPQTEHEVSLHPILTNTHRCFLLKKPKFQYPQWVGQIQGNAVCPRATVERWQESRGQAELWVLCPPTLQEHLWWTPWTLIINLVFPWGRNCSFPHGGRAAQPFSIWEMGFLVLTNIYMFFSLLSALPVS